VQASAWPISGSANLQENTVLHSQPPPALAVNAMNDSAARQEKMFQPCAPGISHDEQKINPRIIILH
jgi:hypothetical protein